MPFYVRSRSSSSLLLSPAISPKPPEMKTSPSNSSAKLPRTWLRHTNLSYLETPSYSPVSPSLSTRIPARRIQPFVHVTPSHIKRARDHNGLKVLDIILPWTKCSSTGEKTQCPTPRTSSMAREPSQHQRSRPRRPPLCLEASKQSQTPHETFGHNPRPQPRIPVRHARSKRLQHPHRWYPTLPSLGQSIRRLVDGRGTRSHYT